MQTMDEGRVFQIKGKLRAETLEGKGGLCLRCKISEISNMKRWKE